MPYQKQIKKVRGKKEAEIFLFALSTCGWCRRTKDFLNSLGVEYSYVDVDLLNDEDQEEVHEIFDDYNTDASFPKIIINNKKVISGFDEKEIREALKNGN